MPRYIDLFFFQGRELKKKKKMKDELVALYVDGLHLDKEDLYFVDTFKRHVKLDMGKLELFCSIFSAINELS